MIAVDLRALERRREAALRLTGRKFLRTTADAEAFLAEVGIALRYGAAKTLPLASLRRAAGPDDDSAALLRAIDLTNHLLGTAVAIEVTVVAGRLALVHRSVVPALYALVARRPGEDDERDLSLDARAALRLIRERREMSVGDVRRHLGLAADERGGPAHAALGELQARMLVDRGPFERPTTGVPYLSREGYPYHLFREAHRDLAREAARLTRARAADDFLRAYLTGAIVCAIARLQTMFRGFLSADEIGASLTRLAGAGVVGLTGAGRARVAIAAGASRETSR